MKTPQRKFVVEFKSGRRQPKTQAASIWGDTDLKALARQVEDQASHLFGGDRITTPDAATPIATTEPVVETEALGPTNKESLGSTPAPIELPGTTQSPVERPTVSKTLIAATESPQKHVALAKPTPVPTAKDGSQVPPASIAIATVAQDELVALEAENKSLRQLLAKQLRSQNLELRKMLRRF